LTFGQASFNQTKQKAGSADKPGLAGLCVEPAILGYRLAAGAEQLTCRACSAKTSANAANAYRIVRFRLRMRVILVYCETVNKLQRIHQQKASWRKVDRQARAKGRRLPDALCLAKSVDPRVFKRPLSFAKVRVPADYED